MFSSTRKRLRWALLGAVGAALIVTTAALGGSGVGGVFNLGVTNTVNGSSTLTGTTSGAQLRAINGSTGSASVGLYGSSASATGAAVQGVNMAGGPAFRATVSGNTVAPLMVNSTHVVPNLHAANSDALASHALSYFLPATGTAANSSKLGGKLPSGFWQLGGNAPGATGVLGTTNNNALELEANAGRALRIEPNTTSGSSFPDAPSLIGGSKVNGNPAGSGAYALTIAGGGDAFDPNQGTDNYGTVSGGFANVVGDLDADPGTAEEATVGGGAGNRAGALGATVGGGDNNTAGPGQRSTVSGGTANKASGLESAVAGGGGNTASGGDSFVAGGTANTASGQYSFAGGRRAKATHAGSFVWGDSTNADVSDNGADTFTVRANGGTYIQGPEIVGGALTSGVGFLVDGDTTPSISGGNLFVTADTTPTTITNFDGAYVAQTITIIFNDNNTTVQDNATILLKGGVDFAAATNDTLTLTTVLGKWYEVSRSVNH
jgi:hypothetical protein